MSLSVSLQYFLCLAFGIVLLSFSTSRLNAQDNPYSDLDNREIKALSAEEISQLLSGAGMGAALAAELNGYPGPRHVIDLREEMHLTETQFKKISDIFNDMHSRAIELGKSIVSAEGRLDSLFASGSVTDATLSGQTAILGRLYGQLRYTHLQAHLTTTAVLNDHQLQMYDALRGYSDHTSHEGH